MVRSVAPLRQIFPRKKHGAIYKPPCSLSLRRRVNLAFRLRLRVPAGSPSPRSPPPPPPEGSHASTHCSPALAQTISSGTALASPHVDGAWRTTPDVLTGSVYDAADASEPVDGPIVSLSCAHSPNICEATASGGSGTGYSFTWSTNAFEQHDADGYSWAYFACAVSTNLVISVTVSDSNGATASTSRTQYCPGWNGL
jgi:hypothetical protein